MVIYILKENALRKVYISINQSIRYNQAYTIRSHVRRDRMILQLNIASIGLNSFYN